MRPVRESQFKAPAGWPATAVGVMYALAAYLQLVYLQPNLDSSWLLIAVDRMLDGGSYLHDFLEVNPPWVLLVYAPAGWAARATGADPYVLLVLLIFSFIAVTLVLTARVTGRCCARGSAVRRWLPVASAFFLLLYPVYEFGQRDYLVCVFALPWLALQGATPWRQAMPGRLAAGLGVWAAFGLFMKPPFVVLPVALALGRAAACRSVRPIFAPDMIAFGLMGLAYIAIVLVRFPDFLTVASNLGHTYVSYHLPLEIVTGRTVPFAAFAVVLPAFAHFVVRYPDERRTVLVLSVAVLVATLSVMLQHKGWWYHRLPIMIFGGISGVLVAAMAVRQIAAGQSRRAVLYPGVAMLALGAVMFAVEPVQSLITKTRASYMNSALYTRLAGIAPGKPVYVFSSNLDGGFPIVPMLGATWASRQSSQWLVAGYVYAARQDALPAARLGELEALVRRVVREDFERYRPEIVLVDRRLKKQGFAESFEFVDFFTGDPKFAEIWRNYTFLENMSRFDIYLRNVRPGAVPAREEQQGEASLGSGVSGFSQQPVACCYPGAAYRTGRLPVGGAAWAPSVHTFLAARRRTSAEALEPWQRVPYKKSRSAGVVQW